MKTKDIRINEALIMKYSPCREGVANFNRHYKDISIKTLINSKNISYDDKIWLLRIIVPKELMVLWSIDSSFVTYEYSVIYFTYRDFASDAASNAANAASDYSNAAHYAVTAAAYAAHAARGDGNAQNKRLQALLYFIEGE
jgi:hypothetical protein